MKLLKPELLIYSDYLKMSRGAAFFVFKELEKKLSQKFVLGLATGATQIGFRKEFLKLLKIKKPSLKNLFLVNLDEYWPIKKGDRNSYFYEMKVNFWQPLEELKLGFSRKRAFIPDGESKNPKIAAKNYEKLLTKLNGVDLQMLGIGVEGHIGFNEKGSSSFSRTHLTNLAPSTIEANKAFFHQKGKAVPEKAITMGIATVLEAKKILLLANGKKKQSVIKKLLQTKPIKDLPASFLKLHPDVTIMLDKEAYDK